MPDEQKRRANVPNSSMAEYYSSASQKQAANGNPPMTQPADSTTIDLVELILPAAGELKIDSGPCDWFAIIAGVYTSFCNAPI